LLRDLCSLSFRSEKTACSAGGFAGLVREIVHGNMATLRYVKVAIRFSES
jgi:hypothetical protein